MTKDYVVWIAGGPFIDGACETRTVHATRRIDGTDTVIGEGNMLTDLVANENDVYALEEPCTVLRFDLRGGRPPVSSATLTTDICRPVAIAGRDLLVGILRSGEATLVYSLPLYFGPGSRARLTSFRGSQGAVHDVIPYHDLLFFTDLSRHLFSHRTPLPKGNAVAERITDELPAGILATDGRDIFVNNWDGNTVFMHNTSDRSFVRLFQARQILVMRARRQHVFFTDRSTKAVYAYDVQRRKLVKMAEGPGQAGTFDVDDSLIAWAASRGRGAESLMARAW